MDVKLPKLAPPSRQVMHPHPMVREESFRERRPTGTCPICGLRDADTIGDGSDLEALASTAISGEPVCMAHPMRGKGSKERWLICAGPLVNEAPRGWAMDRLVGEIADSTGLEARVVQLRRRTVRERLADVRERRAARARRRSSRLADGGPARVDLSPPSVWERPASWPVYAGWWRA